MTTESVSSARFTNLEAEKSLLGFLLVNNDYFEEIVDLVFPEIFSLDIHQRVFKVIKNILDKGQVADVVTVSNYSVYSDEHKDVTFEYLIDLTNSVVSVGSYKDYAILLHDLYLKRQILLLQSNISDYLGKEESASEQIGRLERDIFSLADKGSIEVNTDRFEHSLELALEAVRVARQNKHGVSGITTGFKDLDAKLGGLQKSDLIVLAGRPSMGKTALATNIVFNAARKFMETGEIGTPAAIFSLEMSSEQIASRILSSQVGLASDVLRRGYLDDSDFARLVAAVQTLKNVPLFINDTPGITISQLRSKCRQMKRKHNIGLIMIDYIQLISSGKSFDRDGRVNEVSNITRGLKSIAKELNVPVIALSQLSRAVEAREDKKPMLSDLRESGSIEQDADIVSFIYREEYYIEREEPKNTTADKYKESHDKWQIRMDNARNKATIIIAKNRHGAIGNIDLLFNSAKTEFVDLDKIHEPR